MRLIAAAFFILCVVYALPASAQEIVRLIRVQSGTGFFVNRQYIITNAHVVEGCSKVTIRGAVNEHEATVKARDTEHDLAIIETDDPPRQFAPLRFNIEALRPGDKVYVIGYPGENGIRGESKVMQGQVQDIAPTVQGINPGHFYISDILDHGNSGGPVIDASGNVIGVVVAMTSINTINSATQEKVAEQRVGVVISLNTLKQFLVDQGTYFQWTESGLQLSDSYIEQRVMDYLVNVQCKQPGSMP
jgi:serine protease Do